MVFLKNISSHATGDLDHVIVGQDHADDRIVVADLEVVLCHVTNHVSVVIRKRLR